MPLLRLWTHGFVAWVIAFSIAAYLAPSLFAWMRPYIPWGLGVIMLGMGVTLLPADFVRVARMPSAVSCGVVGQFLIMPALGWGLARVAGLPPDLAMGMIIVGSCPGGTASNVVAYLAKGDVALSVTMTACSTLLAVALTPLLVEFYGGSVLPVDGWALFRDLLYVVLIPVSIGLVLRVTLGRRIEPVLAIFPALSVLVIVLIIATIVSLTRDRLPQALGIVGALVVAHNVLGLALGYGLATLWRLPVPARRTIAIEVGMQNSGLGVVLAGTHFPGTLAVLPGSIFSVVHNLTGSLLAAWWGRTKVSDDDPDRPAPAAVTSTTSDAG